MVFIQRLTVGSERFWRILSSTSSMSDVPLRMQGVGSLTNVTPSWLAEQSAALLFHKEGPKLERTEVQCRHVSAALKSSGEPPTFPGWGMRKPRKNRRPSSMRGCIIGLHVCPVLSVTLTGSRTWRFSPWPAAPDTFKGCSVHCCRDVRAPFQCSLVTIISALAWTDSSCVHWSLQAPVVCVFLPQGFWSLQSLLGHNNSTGKIILKGNLQQRTLVSPPPIL